MRERTGIKVRERKGSCPTGKNEDKRESERRQRRGAEYCKQYVKTEQDDQTDLISFASF